ncbi:MAG: 4'-phosphopantetheinyl transferase superfamily protein [Candidatus Freyarchaeota archaeon]
MDQPISVVDKLSYMLSSDERKKAGRFYFERDKKRFIVRHGVLRMILRCYLGLKADEMNFCYGQNGKPRLSRLFGNEAIFFSMSSSEDLALYGFARNREIGVDVESIRAIPEMDHIANLILSMREKEFYCSLPKDHRRKAFFTYWARKEAFLKATGEGLSRPFNKIELMFDFDEPTRCFVIDVDRKRLPVWSIFSFEPMPRFIAAVASDGVMGEIRFWQWAGAKIER